MKLREFKQLFDEAQKTFAFNEEKAEAIVSIDDGTTCIALSQKIENGHSILVVVADNDSVQDILGK